MLEELKAPVAYETKGAKSKTIARQLSAFQTTSSKYNKKQVQDEGDNMLSFKQMEA